eukprot:5311686-Pleurochrysis_carterae.AAC.2
MHAVRAEGMRRDQSTSGQQGDEAFQSMAEEVRSELSVEQEVRVATEAENERLERWRREAAEGRKIKGLGG